MKRSNALVLLPHIRIQNANMISGPLSWGFPAMTAFLGAVHRLFREGDFPVQSSGVGVVCHSFQPQASRVSGKYTHVLHLRRFPVNKDGSAASMIEEGRAHLEISLVLGIHGELEAEADGPRLAMAMQERLQGLSLAGGSLLPCRHAASWHDLPDSQSEQLEVFRLFRRRLLPGFALVERRDKLQEHLVLLREKQPEAGALEALLDICRLNWDVEPDPENAERGIWTLRRRDGWLVPIPAGFRALSPLYAPGSVRNARDREVPFRFVESLYTLGEWKSPHRLTSLQELLWQYRTDESAGLYLCTQTQGELQ
ncbi:MAG: type I-F CRISPR-associated protein Csy2 [Desulfovibrio sp.]|nr:type I-F CRISPR-associated protein Csy2 [Desulfovibrio sp.]